MMHINNTPLSMNIINFMLISSDKKVNEMFQRSFTLTGNVNIYDNIADIINNDGHMTPTHIIAKCNDIVNLESTSNGLITVANGWNEKRLSFVLVVEVVYSSTSKSIYFINGFTDYYDPILRNHSGHLSVHMLDKTMDFNINTITLITENLDSRGVPSIKFKDKITILRKQGQAVSYDSMSNECLIRPVDIFSEIFLGTPSTTDYNQEPVETNRSNSNSISFLASILNAIGDANKVNSTYSRAKDTNMSRIDTVKDMVNNTTDKPMMNCPFLTFLFKRTGEVKPSRFRIDDLIDLSQHLDSVTKVFNLKDKEENRRSILSSDVLDDNLQPSLGNILALEFYQIMSSLLFDKMMTRVSIHISNHPNFITVGEVATCISSESLFHTAFNTPDAVNGIDAFLRRIILPKITKDNNIYVDMFADINILGTSSIAITVNSNDPEIYRYNSSMDNMFSPYVSSVQQKDVMTDDVSTIIDKVLGE